MSDPSSPLHYSAQETLVLLLDFHSLFVKYLSAEKALEQAIALRTWARGQDIPVAHALLDGSESASVPSNIKGVARTQQILDTLRSNRAEHWAEPEELRGDEGGEPVFTRRPGYVSALTSQDLPQYLAQRGIKSLVLCGLSTSGCVLRTACAATDAGFVVSVIEDACADEPETHRVVAGKVLQMRAHVFSFDEFKTEWERSRQSTDV